MGTRRDCESMTQQGTERSLVMFGKQNAGEMVKHEAENIIAGMIVTGLSCEF